MKSTRSWIILATVFGAWLRFRHIGALSLWFDEGYTAWAISHPAGEIVRLIGTDTSPPLYYLLLHFWSLLFGTSETALRSMSALLGVATIPIVADVARRLLKQPAAVIAATWIFTFTFMQTAYAQEARNYELVSFLTAVIVWSLIRHLERPNTRWLALMIAAGGCALYADNLMPFYLAAIAVAGLTFPSVIPVQRRMQDGMIVMTSLAVIYLPWVSVLRSQMERVNQDFWLPRPTWDSVCDCLSRVAGVGHFWSWDRFIHPIFYQVDVGVPRMGAILLACGVVAAVIFLRREKRRTAMGLIVIGLVPPLAEAVYSLWKRPIFFPSHAIGSTVVLPILMAGLLVWVKRRGVAAFVVAGLIVLVAVNLAAEELERTKEDWRGAAAAVAGLPTSPRRLIVFVANEGQLPFDYYYPLRPGEEETGAPAGFFDVDPPRTQRRVLADGDLNGLRKLIASGTFDDFVLVAAHTAYSDPGDRTVDYLLDVGTLKKRIDLANQAIVVVWIQPRR